jgi:succinyl-CoA synthetase beta subunit
MARGTVIKAIQVQDSEIVFRVSGSGEQVGAAILKDNGLWCMTVGDVETIHRSKSSMMKALRFAPVRSK